MLPLEQARERILSLVHPLPKEIVPLREAAGRTVAADIAAQCDLPPFDNSAMDGYAVRAQDTSQASPESQVLLRLAGRAPAGKVYTGSLSPGECVRVFTGSPLPAGADAVIMQEDTNVSSDDPERVRVLCPVQARENVRFHGADVRRGSVIVPVGARVNAARIALLAAAGCAEVAVRRKPVAGLIATGDELIEAGRRLGPGQIHESNRAALAALCHEAGADPRLYPLVPDDLDATRAALQSALAECDVVVTSGGVSIGEMDLVKAAFTGLGGELSFWKVAIKPGKPFVLGAWEGKLLFGLPGNPVSAFVTFLLLVRPALRRMQGAAQELLPERPGILAEPLENTGDRRHFVRVDLDGAGRVRVPGLQASHMLGSLSQSNGLVDVPPQTALESGATVRVLCWGD